MIGSIGFLFTWQAEGKNEEKSAVTRCPSRSITSPDGARVTAHALKPYLFSSHPESLGEWQLINWRNHPLAQMGRKKRTIYLPPDDEEDEFSPSAPCSTGTIPRHGLKPPRDSSFPFGSGQSTTTFITPTPCFDSLQKSQLSWQSGPQVSCPIQHPVPPAQLPIPVLCLERSFPSRKKMSRGPAAVSRWNVLLWVSRAHVHRGFAFSILGGRWGGTLGGRQTKVDDAAAVLGNHTASGFAFECQ